MSSFIYDRTSGIHFTGGLSATAESQGRVKKKKEEKKILENVAIAIHCNLRPPDAAVVVIRFN